MLHLVVVLEEVLAPVSEEVEGVEVVVVVEGAVEVVGDVDPAAARKAIRNGFQ
jgi:hypothetical protein